MVGKHKSAGFARYVDLAPIVAITIGGSSFLAVACSEAIPDCRLFKGHADRPACLATFTTSSATLASVDVSPDDQMLVFDLLGHLYIMPIGGGTARPITSGTAWDAMPHFSPDGRSIVFVSDRSGSSNLWIVGTDGRGLRSVTVGRDVTYLDPIFTPDGTRIVAAASRLRTANQFDLWSYPASPSFAGADSQKALWPAEQARSQGVTCDFAEQGFLGRPLGPCPAVMRIHPTQSQDGSLYFALKRSVDPSDRYQWEVTKAHGDSTNRVATVDEPMADTLNATVRPIVSKDGRYLAYARLRDTTACWRLRDLRTGTDTPLVPCDSHFPVSQVGIATADLMSSGAFTPDDNGFVVFSHGKLWRASIPSGALTPIPFSARVTVRLKPLSHFDHRIDSGAIIASQLTHAEPSPDGRRLAFGAFGRLYLVDLPRGIVHRVTSGLPSRVTEFLPIWSPDSRNLAFATWDDTAGGYVYRIRVDDTPGNPERATRTAGMYEPLGFAPDGSTIIAMFRRATRAVGTDDLERSHATHLLSIAFDSVSATIGDAFDMPGFQWSQTNAERVRVGLDEHSIEFVIGKPPHGAAIVRVDREDGKIHTVLLLRSTSDAAIAPDRKSALVSVFSGGIFLVRGLDRLGSDTTDSISFADPASVQRLQAGGRISVDRIAGTAGDDLGWMADGKRVFYSRGRAFYLYDIRTRQLTADTITVSMPRNSPRGVLLFHNAKLVTMRGTEHREIIEHGDLLVKDDRIAGVGPTGTVPVPATATIVDLTGHTIVPGFVDVHHHTYDAFWSLFDSSPWQFASDLSFGLTTARNPLANVRLATYADRTDAGNLLAPRFLTTGDAIGTNDADRTEIRSRQEALDRLEYLRANRFATAKFFVEGDVSTTPRYLRESYVDATRALGLTPTVHNAEFRIGMTLRIDGFAGNEHTLAVAAIYDDVVQLSALSGLTYTQTLRGYGSSSAGSLDTLIDGHDPRLLRFMPVQRLDNLERMRSATSDVINPVPLLARQGAAIAAAGGRVGMGSHGNDAGPGVHLEMWAMSAGGMSNLDVLRSATIIGAEALGYGHDLGSLDVGKLADFLVLSRDPLQDIHNTISSIYVVKNGRVYDTMTLDEVFPLAAKYGRQSWQLIPSQVPADTVPRVLGR
jgi:dipeptidyl aminopeptidase/acylaminoacyl peptidase